MRFPVVYRGQEAGWVEVEKGQHDALHFRAKSTVHTSLVLRLYGMTRQKTLLIGVLEPENPSSRAEDDVNRFAGSGGS